jgi:hypothetical protein
LFPFLSKKSPWLWLHGLVLALPIGLAGATLKALETPLPDGTYLAVRGYNAESLNCPSRIEITGVRIERGAISFESGDVAWSGTINEDTGVIRIESAGVTPRPTGDLHIRGHYSKPRLFSDFCGSGYFRIVR